MPSEQFEHIQQIRNDLHQASERVRNSLNNSVRILAQDLYNKHTHFIFELIQNAEDNSYDEPLPSLSFRLTKNDPTGSEGADGALIINNNETGFCPENVDALCAVGKTTKQKAQGYIGEKGIGFKSVFRVTKNPHIFSNGYHFCLPEHDEETELGYIVPQWVDTPPEDLNLSQTNIILPLTKADFGYDKIEEMLLDIEPETILFLSKLQEIRIETDTGTDLVILKNADELPKMEVLVEGSKQSRVFSRVDEFLVRTQTFRKPSAIRHEKREGINHRDVSIAFPLDENATGIRKIFAYLPVSETDFPFLINADFLLTSSRESIHEDEPWNRWLMDCVAEVIASELLPLLKAEQLLTVPFLETLARSLSDLGEDERNLFYPIFSKVRETFMTQAFLPTNDDAFVSAENAKLARGDAVRNLLSHTQLAALFSRPETKIKWLSADITSNRAPTLHKYLMDLGIEEVTPTTFARRLSPPFLAAQSDDWFIEFYRFLSGQSAVMLNLCPKPILRLQDGSNVRPFQEDGSPNAYLPLVETDTDSSLPLVKLDIVQNEDALGFLKKLGIPEWDIVEEVIRDILPKYEAESPKMPVAAYRRDFAKIEHAYKTDSTEQKKRLRQALFNTPFIRVENPPAGDSNYLKPPQLAFASDDRLWANFSGNYSRVSVRKEIFAFLKVLDIQKWNVVGEVIKTILPKYDADSPTVPLQEHRTHFAKFADAYTKGSYFQRTRLSEKLRMTPFILAQCHDADKLVYRKPDELYFPTEELCLYFEGNASCRFISPEYAESHRNMLQALGIRNSIRVVSQSSPGLINDITLHKRRYNRRGLKGFDPDIEVVGLANALKNPSPAKSEIIWNRVVVPYRHCIRGTVIESSKKDFSHSASVYREEETVSQHFGRLLIEKAWLPDADGNLRKPSELTVDNLPASFERDTRLANLLGMKKDKVAELAVETGVSEDAIRELMENPDEYAEFKEWKAAKQAEQTPPNQEHVEAETTDLPRIDYLDEFKKSFNRQGETELRPTDTDEGLVTNPERRRPKAREEHRKRLEDEPSDDERRAQTERTILERPDPQVREYLAQMYDGKCQICQGTFPERNGQPFFIANYIVKRRFTRAVDTSANALCLCADHFARWQHGAVEAEGILSQIENFATKSEGGVREPVLAIKMCGVPCEIRFTEKHLLDLQELIKVSKDEV